MALSKKDRKYVLSNYPSISIGELAGELGVSASEVRAVLASAGRKIESPGPMESGGLLRFSRVSILGVMMLVAAVSVVYLNSTRNGFHYDDIHSLLKNYDVRIDAKMNPDSLKLYYRYFLEPDLFSSRPGVAMPRPLLMCTFGFNYMISAMTCDRRQNDYARCMAANSDPKQCQAQELRSKQCKRGYDPRGWLMLNILIHLANVIIVYVGLCHLGGRRRIALIAAMLFAFHPINTEPVNYVNCRSESLGIFFLLLSLYFFSRSLWQGKIWMTAIFFVVFTLGLLTKEVVFTTLGLAAEKLEVNFWRNRIG